MAIIQELGNCGSSRTGLDAVGVTERSPFHTGNQVDFSFPVCRPFRIATALSASRETIEILK
jgi:hypothetical protein